MGYNTPCSPEFAYIRETIRCIEGLGVSAKEKDQIYRGNAASLLNLSKAMQTV